MEKEIGRMRICFTGTESSGKTTLATYSAEKIGIGYVPEYARDYLEQHGPNYELHDVRRIALKQMELIEQAKRRGDCAVDTDLLVILVWIEDKFDLIDQDILTQLQNDPCDLYVLCSPDIPWEADPLREDANRRSVLHERYIYWLKKLGLNFIEVEGSLEKRFGILQSEIN